MDDVGTRLDRMEREIRRWKRIVAGVSLAFAAVIFMGQARPGKIPMEVEAQRFTIKDETGNIRGGFGVSSNGVFFALLSRDQTTIIELAVGSDGLPLLHFNDAKGARRLAASITEHGDAGLALVDQNLKVRAMLAITDGSPSLVLSDKDGKDRALFKLQPDGDPKILFSDQYYRNRAFLGLNKGTPAIAFLDEKGKAVWGETGAK